MRRLALNLGVYQSNGKINMVAHNGKPLPPVPQVRYSALIEPKESLNRALIEP
jgi:hypothetical protein